MGNSFLTVINNTDSVWMVRLDGERKEQLTVDFFDKILGRTGTHKDEPLGTFEDSVKILAQSLQAEHFFLLKPGDNHKFGKFGVSTLHNATCVRARHVGEKCVIDRLVMKPIGTGATEDSNLNHDMKFWLGKNGTQVIYERKCVDDNAKAFDGQVWKQVITKIKESIVANKRRIPEYVRLAFHDQGTFHRELGKGGGGTVQFMLPKKDKNDPTSLGHNGGLAEPIEVLKGIVGQFENVSLADVIQLAGATAIKMADGPDIPIRVGRRDFPKETALEIINFYKQKYGNLAMSFILPKPNHVTELVTFYGDKFGFDVEKVAVMNGAHTLGGVQRDIFQYKNAKPNHEFLTWTDTPFKFNNDYYKGLFDIKWTGSTFSETDGDKGDTGNLIWVGSKNDNLPKADKELILLETDFVQLMNIRGVDENIAQKWTATCRRFAENEKDFFREFAEAFKQVSEFGWEGKLKDITEE